MIARISALCVVVAGCAGSHRETQLDTLRTLDGPSGLFVGHSVQGDVVVAATHYDAMTGLATTDQELGLRVRKGGDGQMLCQRETPTGSHLPLWTCRYVAETDELRRQTQDWLSRPQFTIVARRAMPAVTAGNIPGGGRGGVAP
ncbi:MAG: hypothetical protein E6J84_00570 [Deltaproteobacteria bacterium]|nr:MAG: hypothetical protein E6J84_00570 [Deltaproteobacteria bacterium]TMA42069.1 MAG: hypothetical protein E6J82_10445 [Deltaproteobacteria bacterium]TMA75308.1 MAG: hypothetical protein E6J67_09375 [Deltaproteobacteria bacterium]TMB41828.1 MAG: hypothetical protein E6J58_02450 [Deltaproteobacteria bacterium]